MISIFLLVTLIGLLCFTYGYLCGDHARLEADARAMVRMAREAARERLT